MFGSVVLEVIIGLSYIYLILSLICTTINEWIATLTRLRAKNLEKAIMCMVNDKTIVAEIYNHPAIRLTAKSTPEKPAYISAQNIAAAFVDIIKARCSVSDIDGPNRCLEQITRGADILPDCPLKTMVKSITDTTENTEHLYKSLEQWFNNAMDQVSGWYKQKIQIISLFVAITITIALNADSVHIINTLYQNSHLREYIIQSAQNNTYQLVNLPLGWNLPISLSPVDWLKRLVGWSLTTFALSLGSSFWFDLLKQVMNIRFTGAKTCATEEKS